MPVFETLLVRSLLMTAVSGGTIVNNKIPPWGNRYNAWLTMLFEPA